MFAKPAQGKRRVRWHNTPRAVKVMGVEVGVGVGGEGCTHVCLSTSTRVSRRSSP